MMMMMRPAFCASLRSRNAHGHVTRGILCGNSAGKMPYVYPTTSVLCEPAQAKCAWTCHKRHFVRNFTGKMPDANPAASILCELRSRNAHGHVTKGILRGNSEGKCWTLPIPPRLNTGP